MMKRLIAVPFLAAVAACGAAAWAFAPNAPADNTATLVIPEDDGYGVDTCLRGGGRCGQAVADAWCVANGYAHAIGIRKAALQDVTGSIAADQEDMSAAVRPGQIAVTCQ